MLDGATIYDPVFRKLVKTLENGNKIDVNGLRHLESSCTNV